ncbi:BolA family transcriptional regulator [Hydrogenophilus islandicus]
MTPEEKYAAIAERLTAALAPQHLVIEDQSAHHAGHNPNAAKGGTHYALTIVSDHFVGKGIVARHRMVYEALGPLMETIHALAITAKAPNEG